MTSSLPCRIIFWHHTPSPHLSALIRALAEEADFASVIVVLIGDLSNERISMGWQLPDYGTANVILKPTPSSIESLLSSSSSLTFHIFSELAYSKILRGILVKACLTSSYIGILSEGRDSRGIKGILRKIHSYILERRWAKRVNFILAIGHLAVDWYEWCGFPQEKIFNFCYVVENPQPTPPILYDPQKPLKFLFVGKLVPRKRVDLLLNALTLLDNQFWQLRIVGSGPIIERLSLQIENLKITDRVQFVGIKSNEKVRQEMSKADVLILPSHWDGWGAVVNEALMSGTRVVCSDFCGAANVISNPQCGEVFRYDSVNALATALDREIKKGKVTPEDRQVIQAYGKSLEGRSVATYLLNILHFLQTDHGEKPIAPWDVN